MTNKEAVKFKKLKEKRANLANTLNYVSGVLDGSIFDPYWSKQNLNKDVVWHNWQLLKNEYDKIDIEYQQLKAKLYPVKIGIPVVVNVVPVELLSDDITVYQFKQKYDYDLSLHALIHNLTLDNTTYKKSKIKDIVMGKYKPKFDELIDLLRQTSTPAFLKQDKKDSTKSK